MRRVLHFSHLLLIVMAPCLLWAQSPKLSVNQTIPTDPPDTLFHNVDSTLVYNITLTNVGGLKATGEVDIVFQFKDSIQKVMATLQVDLESQQSIDTAITDTVFKNEAIPRYGGGGNIIVVWPRAAPDVMAAAPDTGQASIYIKGLPLNRKNPREIYERVQLYPNPTTGTLRFRYTKVGTPLEFISVTDLHGREVYRSARGVMEIPLDNEPNGIYFVQIRYRDGIQGLYRIMLQH